MSDIESSPSSSNITPLIETINYQNSPISKVYEWTYIIILLSNLVLYSIWLPILFSTDAANINKIPNIDILYIITLVCLAVFTTISIIYFIIIYQGNLTIPSHIFFIIQIINLIFGLIALAIGLYFIIYYYIYLFKK